MKLFGADKIIKQHISEGELNTYFVGFDLNDEGKSEYRINKLVNLLINVIPEFAFGINFGEETNNTEIVDKLKEASKAIYEIKEFKEVRDLYNKEGYIDDDISDAFLRRGEFGELILHLLLRDFHKTIPLLSKIYFKDSFSTAVHGFDAVHIQEDTKTLWLGETKIYFNGKKGVSKLIEDIKTHFLRNYMESEFAIISRKIKLLDNIPEKGKWIDLLSNSTTLKEQLDSITIPLLCTYESHIFNEYDNEELPEFIEAYEKEMRELKKYFDEKNDHPLKSNLNIILMLFPIQNKKELIKRLHNNLYMMQKLGEIE